VKDCLDIRASPIIRCPSVDLPENSSRLRCLSVCDMNSHQKENKYDTNDIIKHENSKPSISHVITVMMSMVPAGLHNLNLACGHIECMKSYISRATPSSLNTWILNLFSICQSHICDTVWIGHPHSNQLAPQCKTQSRMSRR
jgi:hypothetical protein